MGAWNLKSVIRGGLTQLAVAACLVLPASALAGTVVYEVAPGDTLGAIASEYGVSVSDIRRWNNLSGDRISIGQELRIHTSSSSGDRVREHYTVRSGDTGGAIARRYDTSLRELQRWNPNVNLDRLRIGQDLTVYVVTAGGNGATGSPNRGRLRSSVQLEPGTGYVVRDPSRAWGTPTTVAAIRNGLARVTARYIDVPSLIIHDLSFERGGAMEPHASHQNGLDVDISYYRNDCEDACDWREVGPDELDVRTQWYLLSAWIEQGLVEYVFMDFDLQRPLFEYAQARGATAEQLSTWFQYPDRDRSGIIRHESGHDDHMHVRFVSE